MADIQKCIINSTADNLPLSLIYAESDAPVGVLQCCHGMAEHKERYIPFIKFMADHGWHCCMHDMRGHGESILAPEDLGYFYNDGKNACIEDLLTVNKHLHEKYTGLPVFLFGHSMGSLEVRSYFKKYPDTVSGLIVCGSPSPVGAVPLGKLLIKLLTLIKGDRHRSSLMNSMALGAYNKPFIEEGPSKNNWISVNRENVEKYDKDPGCGFTFTLNGFAALMDLMSETYDSRGWNVPDPGVPVHFISGEDDPCRGSEKSFAKVLAAFKNAGYRNVSCKLYPGLRHELLNEKKAGTVMDDILGILNGWLSVNMDGSN
ncbi:MAG: alpha/beta fold hydrolase [Bacillota bacterium]|nr:alpha/beta fold hydrolase [Bacillota bacterium]